MAKQARGNDYYRQRLKKERPDLYADINSGKLTIAAARRLAGMGGARTRLHELKNAWNKATPSERGAFLSWAGLSRPAPATSPSTATPAPSTHAVEPDGRLQPWARRRAAEIMTSRSMKSGDLADELGISRRDQSVMMAIQRDTKINTPSTAAALERWLADNTSV